MERGKSVRDRQTNRQTETDRERSKETDRAVRACVCACVCVCVVSVIVKRPVLPPSVVDGRSRNPLYYYYYSRITSKPFSTTYQVVLARIVSV